MEMNDGDVVVFGEPHRRTRVRGECRAVRRGTPLIAPEDGPIVGFDVATVCVPQAKWKAIQALLAAARYWRQTGYNSEYAGEDELAEAIDRLAAVERAAAHDADR